MGYVKKQLGRAKKWAKGRYTTKGKVTGNSVATLAKDIWYLKGLVNAEKKYHDGSLAYTNVDYSGTSTLLSLTDISQGDSQSTRDGLSCFVRHVSINGQIVNNVSASSAIVRVIVFKDKNANPATVAVSDLLQNSGASTSVIARMKYPEARYRFQVLSDKKHTLNTAGVVHKTFAINLPMRHHVRYTGSAGTDLGKGHIYVLVISDLLANLPICQLSWRVMYYDN